LLVLALGLAALTLGCQHDEITEYQVAKPEPTVRLLGAILQHEPDVWYFKLTGPIAAVAEQKDAFDKFLHSVSFPGDGGKPVKWTVPEGWKEQSGPEPRYATIKIEGKDGPLELTVTRFPNQGKAADVLENVNRWRKLDLGLPAPIPAEDLPGLVREDKIAGSTVTFVDATGPGVPTGGRVKGPMEGMGPRMAAHGGGSSSFQYQTPPGWEKVDTSKSMVPIDLKFAIKDSETGQTAEMTVTRAGGNLEANVTRWAKQIDLTRFNEADARKAMRPGTVDKLPAQLVDLEGPGDVGAGRQRILGAIVERDGTQWFFKLKGPHGVVGRQEANFKRFLDSFKFGGGR
jgi:hypothetical protein